MREKVPYVVKLKQEEIALNSAYMKKILGLLSHFIFAETTTLLL